MFLWVRGPRTRLSRDDFFLYSRLTHGENEGQESNRLMWESVESCASTVCVDECVRGKACVPTPRASDTCMLKVHASENIQTIHFDRIYRNRWKVATWGQACMAWLQWKAGRAWMFDLGWVPAPTLCLAEPFAYWKNRTEHTVAALYSDGSCPGLFSSLLSLSLCVCVDVVTKRPPLLTTGHHISHSLPCHLYLNVFKWNYITWSHHCLCFICTQVKREREREKVFHC